MAKGVIPAPLGVIKRWGSVGTSGLTVNVANGARFVVFTLSSSSASCGMWMGWSTNAGAVAYEQINAASNITLSGGTNTLTITPASGTPMVIIFDFTDGIS